MKSTGNIILKTVRKALVGALALASILLPSAQAFIPTAVSADTTATVGQTFDFTVAGTSSFTIPSNVTSVKVETWGAGGAGGNGTVADTVSYAGQGGGAGGYASSTVVVSGGQSFNVVVGQAGSQAGSRTGGESAFGSDVRASGGNGGANWDEIAGNGPTAPVNPLGQVCGTWDGKTVHTDRLWKSEGGLDYYVGTSGAEADTMSCVGAWNASSSTWTSSMFCKYADQRECNFGKSVLGGTPYSGSFPACPVGYHPAGDGCDPDSSGGTGGNTGGTGSTSTNPLGQYCGSWDGKSVSIDRLWKSEGGLDYYVGSSGAAADTMSCVGTWNASSSTWTSSMFCKYADQRECNFGKSILGGTAFNGSFPACPVNYHAAGDGCAADTSSNNTGTGNTSTSTNSGSTGPTMDAYVKLGSHSDGPQQDYCWVEFEDGSFLPAGAAGSIGGSMQGYDANNQPLWSGQPEMYYYLGTTSGVVRSYGCDNANNDNQFYFCAVGTNPATSGSCPQPVAQADSSSPIARMVQAVVAFISPVTAFADEVHDGHGGQGLAGYTRIDGGSAAAVIGGANSTPTAGGTGYLGIGNGGAGSANATGADGATGRVLITVLAVSGGGSGSSDNAPSAPVVTGPTTGIVSTSYDFGLTSSDPEGGAVRFGIDWDNNGTIDEYSAFGASGIAIQIPHSWTAPGTYIFVVYAEDSAGNRSSGTTYTIVISAAGGGGSSNNAPVVSSVTGTTTGSINVSYSFVATATDSDGDDVEYGFDWDNSGAIDGSETWTAASASGVSVTRSNSWTVPGIQNFNVFARDSHGAVSAPYAFSITISGGSSSIGFTLGDTAGLSTSEAGATANFTVVLNSAPLANVTLPVVSTDTTEGTVSTDLLTFTPSNWNVYQNVLVTGVDDTVVDGNIGYSVIVGSSTSSDINFNNLPAQAVNLVNYDNDSSSGGGSSSGGSHGGGGGGGSGGPCYGYGCPTTPATTTSDVLILIDTPVSVPTSSVTPIVPKYCPIDDFIADYMRIGVDNNPNEVRKLQYFLNTYENAGLPIDGVFGTSTEAAVMAFQAKYADSVLSPWGINTPTGIVYITTRAEINKIYCGDHPTYRNGDLSDILDGVLYPPSNPQDFEGVIGSTQATSTNIASVFSAITQDIANILDQIPWYPLLVTLLLLVGMGIMTHGIIKDNQSKEWMLSFAQGTTTYAIGSVLNVLNIMSYILIPDKLFAYTGVGLSWILALLLINLLSLVVILISLLFAIRRKFMTAK